MTRNINKQEVPGVDDVPPKKNKKKRTFEDLLGSVPPPSSTYKPLTVYERPAKPSLPDPGKAYTPYELFRLFITTTHFDIITKNTNRNAFLKQFNQKPLNQRNKHEKEEEKEEDSNTNDAESMHTPRHIFKRQWHDTNRPEITVFFGALLLMGTTHLPKSEDYWKTTAGYGVVNHLQITITCERWHQIKRYLKISNPNTDADSSGLM
ncbi:MAG: hypothetical protein Q9187_008306 [Circinaria calcarea]